MQATPWPPLPLDGWRPTYETLHLWMQIVGKVCLALTPRTNHFWNIAFRVTARGIETPPLIAGEVRLGIRFDFLLHQLVIDTSDGRTEIVDLEAKTVAAFYREVTEALVRLGVRAPIWPVAVELPTPIRLDRDDSHGSYDPTAAESCWRVLLAMQPVLETFRAQFIGKCSPVHFFWGSFDLAVSRFNGRRAPARPEADAITRESYSHEVISHGFWPGSGPVQEAAFYAYSAPEPPGFKTARVQPAAAYYHQELSEFVLPYEAVRTAPSPEAALRAFLHSTYAAAADLAGWDRRELERG